MSNILFAAFNVNSYKNIEYIHVLLWFNENYMNIDFKIYFVWSKCLDNELNKDI